MGDDEIGRENNEKGKVLGYGMNIVIGTMEKEAYNLFSKFE